MAVKQRKNRQNKPLESLVIVQTCAQNMQNSVRWSPSCSKSRRRGIGVGFKLFVRSLLNLSKDPYIRMHLPLPAGAVGFCMRSISSMSSSKAFATLTSNLALASVQGQPSSAAMRIPSSFCTWRCSGRRSVLLPIITIGTFSEPCSRRQS